LVVYGDEAVQTDTLRASTTLRTSYSSTKRTLILQQIPNEKNPLQIHVIHLKFDFIPMESIELSQVINILWSNTSKIEE